MKVLVVDDEQPIMDALVYNLHKEGYQTLTASDAEQGLEIARTQRPDLILLDVMLPSGSGFDVCRLLRKSSNVPIILLTARAEETDRVVGLELGADDYVTKPFSMRELMARVQSVLRRSATADSPTPIRRIQFDDLTIDPERYEVILQNRPVDLSPKEFKLLHFLAMHPGQTFSRQTLLDRVWGEDAFVEERTIDVHIRWLREKLEKTPSEPRRLLTVRGIGYKFSGQ